VSFIDHLLDAINDVHHVWAHSATSELLGIDFRRVGKRQPELGYFNAVEHDLRELWR
jgi:hypothetical protein